MIKTPQLTLRMPPDLPQNLPPETKAIMVQRHRHERCWACGSDRPDGLQLRFTKTPDLSVEAQFDCEESFAGYPGVIHGGVVSAVLDAAMTHCLFARGSEAMTAELKVRFRSAVAVGVPSRIRASLVRVRGHFLEVCAEFWQDGKLCAVSRGKFILNP